MTWCLFNGILPSHKEKKRNNTAMWMGLEIIMGFLAVSVVKICLQCRRPRFDPWVGKISGRRDWLPTRGFLPGKAHGQRSPVGYRACGCKRARHDSVTTQQQRDYHTKWNKSYRKRQIPYTITYIGSQSSSVARHVLLFATPWTAVC